MWNESGIKLQQSQVDQLAKKLGQLTIEVDLKTLEMK
jgi:hypothetical protein